MHFADKNANILIQISLNYIFYDPTDINSASVLVMAQHQIGDKQLSEPMMTLFTDADIHHQAPDHISDLMPMHWSYVSFALSHSH